MKGNDYMENKEALKSNQAGWNAVSKEYFGVTALPTYGPYSPTEDELNLFGDMSGKKVLDIGCGSGHSLSYMGNKGAEELWGLDISSEQINTADIFLKESGYNPNLFVSPMEENPGIPLEHFDVVYSIYALGWTVDLEKTIKLVSSYLKKGGIFVFSWDHPLMQCVSPKDGKISLERPYHDEEFLNMKIRKKQPMVLRNWKMSSYINALSSCGMKIEILNEEVRNDVWENDDEFSEKYYSPYKARKMPLSFIVKAVKL